MIKLVESSGTVICEAGTKLFICKRPARWTSVFLFVSGLLVIILLGNGILQIMMHKPESNGSLKPGFILIGISVIFVIIFWRIKLYQKKVSAIPLHELKVTGIFDFESKNLLDAQQNILTPINNTWLKRKMQFSSSSPELIISWEGGSLSIVKGNPFSGGITEIEKLLMSKGIRKK